jgi:hypothetical protein
MKITPEIRSALSRAARAQGEFYRAVQALQDLTGLSLDETVFYPAGSGYSDEDLTNFFEATTLIPDEEE